MTRPLRTITPPAGEPVGEVGWMWTVHVDGPPMAWRRRVALAMRCHRARAFQPASPPCAFCGRDIRGADRLTMVTLVDVTPPVAEVPSGAYHQACYARAWERLGSEDAPVAMYYARTREGGR